MTTWITDDNDNRASVEHWGSEDAARASLTTLKNCRNCTNCTYCTNCTDCTYCTNCTYCRNCTDCTDCTYCTNCTYCRNCTDCTDCTDCTNCTYSTNCTDCRNCATVRDAKSPAVVGPFRSDGYQFVVNEDGGVRAGCRAFASFAEAREHWDATRPVGTPLGDETRRILDFLEAEYNARKKQ